MKKVNRKEAPQWMLAFSKYNGCKGCYYNAANSLREFFCLRSDDGASCHKEKRKDGRAVIFIKKAPPANGLNPRDAPPGAVAVESVFNNCYSCLYVTRPFDCVRPADWHGSCCSDFRKDGKNVVFHERG